MKKIVVTFLSSVLFLLFLSVQSIFAYEGIPDANGMGVVPVASSPIVVDGAMDAAYANALTVLINSPQYANYNYQTEDYATGIAYILVSSDYTRLYVFAHVDDAIMDDFVGLKGPWDTDSFEIFVDPTNCSDMDEPEDPEEEDCTLALGGTAIQYRQALNGDSTSAYRVNTSGVPIREDGGIPGCFVGVTGDVDWDNYYEVEFEIDLTVYQNTTFGGITCGTGTKLGFQMMINDLYPERTNYCNNILDEYSDEPFNYHKWNNPYPWQTDEWSFITLEKPDRISGFCGDNLTWTFDTITGKLTISGIGNMEWSGEDAPWGLYRTQITDCVVENGVISIRDSAFANCLNLKQISIADTIVHIGSNAFYECTSLEKIFIPSSVVEIESKAFLNCSKLNSVAIINPNLGFSDDVFANTSVTIYGSSGSYAEYCAKEYDLPFVLLTEYDHEHECITIPKLEPTCTENGYTERIYCSICGYEFQKREDIPALNHLVNEQGFCNRCGIDCYQRGTCGDNLKWMLDTDGNLTISGYGEMYISDMAGAPWSYIGNDKVRQVEIHSGVTSIGEGAFSRCAALEGVSIPNTVSRIDRGAFANCSKLSEVTIPNSVTMIGDNAFLNCASLEDIVISNRVAQIGKMAFMGCTKLQSVTIPEGITTISEGLFAYCTELKHVVIPNGVTTIEPNAFEGCSSLESILIPNSVIRIGRQAFLECRGLSSVTAPADIIIEDEAFLYCTGLADDNGFVVVSGILFGYTGSDTIVIIPDNVTKIGTFAFYWNTSLKTVIIPDGVTEIQHRAFLRCWLSTITIPRSVTSIGEDAFESDMLTCIYGYKGSCAHKYATDNSIPFTEICSTHKPTQIPSVEPTCTQVGHSNGARCSVCGFIIEIPEAIPALGHDYNVENICIRCGDAAPGFCGQNVTWLFDEVTGTLTISGIGKMADFPSEYKVPWFSYRSDIKMILIEDGVTSIGNSVFRGCTSLLNVTMPDSITSIGYSAFSMCNHLEFIRIPDAVTSIDTGAFSNCYRLSGIIVSENTTYIAYWAFDGVSKECFSVYDDATYIGSATNPYYALISASYQTTEIHPDTILIAENAFFNGNKDLNTVVVPNKVKYICPSAFNGPDFSTITLGSSVEKIGAYAFDFSYRLDNIMIPESVIDINDKAFDRSGLRSITGYYNSYAQSFAQRLGYEFIGICPEHQSSKIPATEPTCTKSGLSEGEKCLVCGEFLVKQEVIPALGHDFENGVCTRCGEKESGPEMKNPFTDVKKKDWFFSAVLYAYENGLFKGTSDNTFDPNGKMTRSMLVSVLWRYQGEPVPTGKNPFIDVKAKSWYGPAVIWAAENSIVSGVSTDKFSPDGNISREQIASILYRYTEFRGGDLMLSGELAGFPDAKKVSKWAKTALSWAVGSGLVTGAKVGGETVLNPQGEATRAEVASILQRYTSK